MAEVERTDKENLKRLKEIVDEFGWPTFSLVGKEAANAAFLIVQHGVSDQPFMRKCLKLMEPLLEKGEVAKPSYALLWDRTALQQKKKQRYGSQVMASDGKWVVMDVEDPANLDKRRASNEYQLARSRSSSAISSSVKASAKSGLPPQLGGRPPQV